MNLQSLDWSFMNSISLGWCAFSYWSYLWEFIVSGFSVTMLYWKLDTVKFLDMSVRFQLDQISVHRGPLRSVWSQSETRKMRFPSLEGYLIQIKVSQRLGPLNGPFKSDEEYQDEISGTRGPIDSRGSY